MLNENVLQLCQHAAENQQPLGISLVPSANGCRIFDCGVESPGSQAAGILLARICLADLATVEVLPVEPWPQVHVRTEHAVSACMAAQYAGWEVKGDSFFAMGSGPMRAAAAREPLFEQIGFQERPGQCVGVLESARLPPDDVCQTIAEKCGVAPEKLTLFVAPTSSIAGTLQVVARSVESALHKLHELEFDLFRIVYGEGSAPLPPVATGDLAAIGCTNDAILYGSEVTLTVRGDDHSLERNGEQLPSSASPDYGRPFAEILAEYDNDFYRVDPLLFSAAKIRLVNLDSGNSFEFGQLNNEVLHKSFAQGL